MTAAEIAHMDSMEESYNESMGASGASGSSPTRASGSRAPLAGSSAAEHATTPEPQPQPQAPPKRKHKITHDRFVQMQSLLILHISETEKRLTKGVDRDELIDWYLEQKEEELQSIEDLEYEKELVGKVLKKLVKVGRYFLPL